jgi:predicted metal-binding membrane protein
MNRLTIGYDAKPDADPDAVTATTRRFFIAVALVFAAGVAATLALSHSMHAWPSMPGTPMPGNWTLSMTWTRACGRTWLRASASYLAMWSTMMVAMMLPSFAPHLRGRPLGAAAMLSAGYASIWIAFGAASFAGGTLLAALAWRLPVLARAVPIAGACTLIAAGALQTSAWKARALACCRSTVAGAGWRGGIRHGLHCVRCCAPLTAAWFVFGVMDLRAMTLAALAITLERLARMPARWSGVAMIAAGAWLLLGL